MPFFEINNDSDSLLEHGLPDRLDDQHKFYYQIFKNSDGNSIFISQRYSHCSESFETEVLVVGDKKFLLEHKLSWTQVGDSWDSELREIVLYADKMDLMSMREKLTTYVSEIRALFPLRSPCTKIGNDVKLRLVESHPVGKSILERFPKG